MRQLPINEHKDPEEDGSYPTRLLIPATNFAQCYTKLAYNAIKAIFDDNDIQYDKHTIVQSSHLKCKLEKLELKADNSTITSLDIKDMYHLIRYKLVQKSIQHYSEAFGKEEMEVIEAALEMLKFSMGNTLVTFCERYCEYEVEDDPVMRALTVGGYNSGWYTDMVASYIIDLAKDHVSIASFFGIYRDDGNVLFEENRTCKELQKWLQALQVHMNKITDGDIQFTMDIWKPREDSRTIEDKKIMVIGDNNFPYLDMEMSYDANQNLKFGVHTKSGTKTGIPTLKARTPWPVKRQYPEA